MIKKWNNFTNEEFIENFDNSIDSKMAELSDLIEGLSKDENLLYHWENKTNDELVINFTSGELYVKYEFNIKDLVITKIVGENVDFTTDVSSIDEALSIVEKDIHSILGLSEKNNNNEMENMKKFNEFVYESDEFKYDDIEGETIDDHTIDGDTISSIEDLTLDEGEYDLEETEEYGDYDLDNGDDSEEYDGDEDYNDDDEDDYSVDFDEEDFEGDEDIEKDLSVELVYRLRNIDENDEKGLTVDDFLIEVGVDPNDMTGFAWAAILNNAQKYDNMDDDEFNQFYKKYKSDGRK